MRSVRKQSATADVFTQRVMESKSAKGPGRLVIRADDPTLTAHAGLAISGELVRGLGLVGLLDAEIAAEYRAAPVKVRRRGASPGELLLALAECQLAGGECFDDLEDVRADDASAPLRAVASVPSAPAARQLARRFRRCHLQAAERALAAAGHALDEALGRDPAEPVTIDLDATEVTVYGNKKQGTGRTRTGNLAYAPHIASWAERGRALTAELCAGNRVRLPAAECAKIVRRALKLLPKGHGPVSFRVDSAYYQLELLRAIRAANARFTVSVPRNQAIWKALDRIPSDAWADATDMPGAEVAETTYAPEGSNGEPLRLIARRTPFSAAKIAAGSVNARRRKTIHPEQLQLALEGKVLSVFGYSFILTDHPAEQTTAEVEHHHRQRGQIEERIKDAKLGQALRHLPVRDLNANRVWMFASLLALNLSAMICDLSPAAAASGAADDERTPLRRHAKALRRLLFCVPARVLRSGRQTILRLPAGMRKAEALIFQRTYDAVWALAPP